MNITADNDEYYYIEYSNHIRNTFFKIDSFIGLMDYIKLSFLPLKKKIGHINESKDEKLWEYLGNHYGEFAKILARKSLKKFNSKELKNIKDCIDKYNMIFKSKLDNKFVSLDNTNWHAHCLVTNLRDKRGLPFYDIDSDRTQIINVEETLSISNNWINHLH
jgi:hypothetical protein